MPQRNKLFIIYINVYEILVVVFYDKAVWRGMVLSGVEDVDQTFVCVCVVLNMRCEL